MSLRRKKSTIPGYKACRNCKMLVPEDEPECPNCGSKEFSREWIGVIIVIDPEKSRIAKELDLKKPGMYAVEVR